MNDVGDARPSPYCVPSCFLAARASVVMSETTARVRAPVHSVARRMTVVFLARAAV